MAITVDLLCSQKAQQPKCVARCGMLVWDGNQVVRSYTQQYLDWDGGERSKKLGLLTITVKHDGNSPGRVYRRGGNWFKLNTLVCRSRR